MDVKRFGAWGRAAELLASLPGRMEHAVDRALIVEAQFFRTKIGEGIREQPPGGKAFAPLAPTTLAVRRFRGFKGTKALIVRGDLRNSIRVVKEKGRSSSEYCEPPRDEPGSHSSTSPPFTKRGRVRSW